MAFVDEKSGEVNVKLVVFGPVAAANGAFVREAYRGFLKMGPIDLVVAPGDDELIGAKSTAVFFAAAIPLPKSQGSAMTLHLYTLEGAPVEKDWEYVLQGLDGVIFVGGPGGEAAEETLREIVDSFEYAIPTPVVVAPPATDPLTVVQGALREVLEVVRATAPTP